MKQTMNSIKNSIASLLRSTGVLTITVGVLMTATAACSETELATGTAGNEAWQNDPDALRISATVGGAFGSNGAATRSNPMGDMDDDASTDQTVFNPGDTIGVYTDDQDKVLYTLSADGTTWKPLDGNYLKWTSNTMQVYAYYPVTSYVVTVNGGTTSKNDAKNFTLSNVQNTAERIAKADYMTFNGIVTRTDGSANLKLPMQRRTARVIINITSAGDEIDKENDVIEYPQIGSLYQTYTDDVASNNGLGRAVDSYADRKGKNGFNSATRFTTLVIPAEEETVSSDVNWFAISVNGNVFKVSTIPAMKAGYSYTYNLKLGKDKVTISGITVQDWSTGATLPGGQEADEAPIVQDSNITLPSAGTLDDASLTQAIGSGDTISLSGSMNTKDFATLRDWAISNKDTHPLKSLNLSGLTGLTELPEYAFMIKLNEYTSQSVTTLETVTLPATVTKIGAYAFTNCTALTAINLKNVTEIGQYAFKGCSALKSINLDNVTAIGAYGFRNCSSLGVIDAPKLEILTEHVFWGCGNVTGINLPAVTGVEGEDVGALADITVASGGVINLPLCKGVGKNMFSGMSASGATLNLTAPGAITMHKYAFNSTFTYENAPKLVLNADKKEGGSGSPTVSDNSWGNKNGSTFYSGWASISYVNNDGTPAE